MYKLLIRLNLYPVKIQYLGNGLFVKTYKNGYKKVSLNKKLLW